MPETDGLSLVPHVCMAELLCEAPVILTNAVRMAVTADIREALGGVTVLRSDEEALHLALDGYPVEYEEGQVVPAQILFMSDASPKMNPDARKMAEALETSLGQTWGWAEARSVAAHARHTLLVTEFLATGLEPRQRAYVFPRVLYAAAKHIPCAALHFPKSQCLVDPEAFLALPPGDDERYSLQGLVNVRLFSVRDAEDEIVMDTLGLHVLGLPDLQCHRAGVNPDDLAAWLYSLAAYVAETETVIDGGDTVDAFDGIPTRMEYEESLVEPRRVVLNLQPVPDA